MTRRDRTDCLAPGSARALTDVGPLGPTAADPVRRELILETAASVFAELGYRRTWAGDILAAAGIPRDTLYPDFADKEACFLAVLDRSVAEGQAQMVAATRGQAGWARQTYAGLQALLREMEVGSPGLRILLVEAPIAGAAAVARHDRVSATAVAWLGRARGRYPEAADLPDCFEQMVVDGVAFLLRQCLLESPRPAMPELLLETSRYVIEPFVGPEKLRRLEAEFAASSPASD